MTSSTIAVPVEVSADLLEIVGPPEVISARLRQALIMDLVFDNVVSQGKAAELLGISVGEVLDLIASYQSRQNGLTAEEMLDDVRLLELMQRERAARASD